MQKFLSMIVLLLASSACPCDGGDAGWEKKKYVCYKKCASGEKTVGAQDVKCQKPCPKGYITSSFGSAKCKNPNTGDVLDDIMVYEREKKKCYSPRPQYT